MTRLHSMSHSSPPLSLDSSVLLHAIVNSERIRKAKELEQQKELAAAKTDLQRAVVRFWHRMRDFQDCWSNERPRSLLPLSVLLAEPLAVASTHLAEAAKRAMPTYQVKELIRLTFELRSHRDKDGQRCEPSQELRRCIRDAVVLARDIEMTIESPPPRRKRTAKKSGHISAGLDAQACKLAVGHIHAGEPWNVTSIAKELRVSRQSLDGKNGRGEYRCPHFMALVKNHRHRATLTYRGSIDDQARNE